MTSSIRELIIAEIMTRAATILTATSPVIYNLNIGAHVYRAVRPVDPANLPCAVVWPQPETASYKNGMVENSMPVIVEGMAKFGSSNPSTIAEQILADLIKCFASPNWDRRRVKTASPLTYYDPYADSIIYVQGGTNSYPESGDTIIGAQATFNVMYWTAAGDPYTQ